MYATRHPIQSLASLLLIACLLTAPALSTPSRGQIRVAQAPAALSLAPFGINTHLATRTTDMAKIDTAADLIVRAGAGWAREDIHWYRVQPTADTWDWSYTDAAIGALVTRGVQVVGVIGHPPGWATPDSADSPLGYSFSAPDPQLFAAFAQAVAVRYSRYVTHWEIWNEPDNPLFWKPMPNATAYARLLTATSVAIRSAVPSARIVLGGISPFDTHFLQGIADAGAWGSFDIVAIHPYVDPAAPESANLGSVADGVRALANRYGARPIWVTEIGWASAPDSRHPPGSTDEQTQANMLVRATLLLWQAGVERIFWYTLKDDPEGDTYGLFALGSGRSDFSQPKPAYTAFQTLSRQLAGASYASMSDLFARSVVVDFEQFGVWLRGDQPYGRLSATTLRQHAGSTAAQLEYRFPTRENDYVVFRRAPAVPIPGSPYAIGMWVYGDTSGHTLKIWLRDAEGEILQYTLGAIGPPGWRFMQAQLAGSVPSWNRISAGGNGRLDMPARVEGLVLDDGPDSFVGSGSIIIDDITALSGPEGYDLRVQQNQAQVDVLWAPQPVLVSIASPGATASVSTRDGGQRSVAVRNGRLVLTIGPAVTYVRHAP